jgi:hypothetical protein
VGRDSARELSTLSRGVNRPGLQIPHFQELSRGENRLIVWGEPARLVVIPWEEPAKLLVGIN